MAQQLSGTAHVFGAFTTMKSKQQIQSFDDVSLLYVSLLRVVGLVPFEGREYDFLGTRLLLVLFIVAGFVNWTMLISDSYNKKTVSVDFVFELVLVTGVHSRYYLMLGRRSRLLAMLEECRGIWHECIGERGHRTVTAFERQMRLMLMTMSTISIACVVMYDSMAFVNQPATSSPRLINSTQPARILPFKWYIDNADEHWPGYWATFLIQDVVIGCTSMITTTCDTASPFLMVIASGYFRCLTEYFVRSCLPSSDDRPAHRYSELIRHVKLHQRLLKFCDELERFGRPVFFIQLLSTGYNMSLIGIKLLGSDPGKYKYVPFLCACFYQLVLCQWGPDMLSTESSRVATAAYFSSANWMQSRVGKLLVVVIARAQLPVQMTAGGVVNLSLERFGAMMSSALSFFTVLRNFNL